MTRYTLRSLAMLISQNDRRYTDNFGSSQRALEVALRANDVTLSAIQRDVETLRASSVRGATLSESNEKTAAVERNTLDKRLESMNEFRAQLSDQTQTFLTRSEFNGIIKPMDRKINHLIKPNWTMLISTLTSVFVMVGGAWGIMGLKIDNAINPLTVSLESIKAIQVGRAVEINDLGLRIRNIDSSIAISQTERRQSIAELRGKIIELETISSAGVKQRTLVTDEFTRWMTIIYEKVFPGQKFPKVSE
jgi:hypothetical protein